MALKFTEEEIEQGIVDPIITIVNQALSGADNETVDLVIEKLKAATGKLNSNEEFDLQKIVHAPIVIGKTISAKTETKKDDNAFLVIETIEGILFGGGGLFGNLIKLGKGIKEVKKG